MNEDYDGVEVVDTAGERVGTVERTYIDDSNAPRFVEVKSGMLLPKHRLIPIADSQLTDEGQLQVGYSKDIIEGSPDAPKGDTLEQSDLDAINAYYSDNDGTEAGADSPMEAGSSSSPPMAGGNVEAATEDTSRRQFDIVDESEGGLRIRDQIPSGLEAPIRDRGDVVEVPVLQEVLVKKTVVSDIIRVKKSDIIEQETVEGDVRKESIEVDDETGAVVDSDAETAPR